MMRNSYTNKLINNVAHFNGNTFQKISSCRNIIKQVFNRKLGSISNRNWTLINHFTAFYFNMSTYFVLLAFGFHFHMRNGGNRS